MPTATGGQQSHGQPTPGDTAQRAQSKALENLSINTIRTLSMDAVQAADSGHPGTPMALAPVAYTLWAETLRFDPNHPEWPGRDRFILSCGHASMLLYSLIHLAGVKAVDEDGIATDKPAITLDNIKNFRQYESPCAGHPEYGYAAGIETTTGPLGQGVANSVGMAISSKFLGARYNKPGYELFNFNTFALCSDGDLMEGVAAEAASLAGHLKLSNLCWIYDDNKITIEGHTDLAFTENVKKRFEGYGWKVAHISDANNTDAMREALDTFEETDDRPTLIIVQSIIGYGSPNKANSHNAHGSPLGADEIKLTKEVYGWPADQKFLVPEEVPAHFADTLGARGGKAFSRWQEMFKKYKKEHQAEGEQLELIFNRKLPQDWDKDIPVFETSDKGTATRNSSGKVLNGIAKRIPWLIGGSADLAGSTKTLLTFEDSAGKDAGGDFEADNYAGRNMHFGIREHGMAAACNGMSLCGLRSYGATFFVFTDYMRASMRLSSIMHQPVLYVLTHDSIGLGEDGPTHQPVEHLAACRAIPGLLVMRPGDANEVAACYRAAIKQSNRPVAMVLSRQDVPTFDRSKYGAAAGAEQGGYILADAEGGNPTVILMATGTELPIVMEAYQQLTAEGVAARVVSMPCWELFNEQDIDYRESVLPTSVQARVACEAGLEMGWGRYLGFYGEFVGMTGFGASAPYQTLYEIFGITPDHVGKAAKRSIARVSGR